MNKSFLSILITATVLFSACKDELEQNSGIPIVEGDEINFGASNLVTFGDGHSDFSRTTNSRTSYGDAYYDANGWHYPLNWVYGDQIKVYCDEAADKKLADYKIEWADGVEGSIATNNNTAYMVKIGENGLHWGDVTKDHNFWAFYPASSINKDTDFEKGIVHDTIPNTQEMLIWENKTILVNGVEQQALVGKPNMNYAFMAAKTTVNPQTANNKVALDFKPLTTAVEITLQGADNITGGSAPLTAVQITSANSTGTEKQAVCGAFAYNILTGENTVNNTDVATDYMITVPLWQKNGDELVPLELKPNQIVRFTVFLLPGSDSNGERTLKNLQVRVPGWNTGVRVKYYDNINLEVGTKSQIWLPDYDTKGNVNTWLGSLPDNVYISQLSIPGSVNAFSKSILPDYSYPGVGQDEMDLTQDLEVEQQFSYGVRAFEIATERWSSLLASQNTINGKNLGTEGSLIAGTTTSSNLNNALTRLAQLVKDNQSEFVIVMPYYAPDETQNAEGWSHQLQNYLQSLPKINEHPSVNEVEILPFSNSMTIGEARGKILCLSRMPSGKESVDGWVGNPVYTSAIYGWDSDKNRWERRGYNMSAEGFWTDGQWNGNSNPALAGYTNPTYLNWKYDAAMPASTGTSTTESVTFYIQDWFRVCDAPDGSARYQHADGIFSSSTIWYDSKNEKIRNIKEFMDQTIGVLSKDVTGNSVFINSLAGYYIISKSSGVSALPAPTTLHPDYGKHGDIPPFARDMNNEVYNYILNLDYNSRGPLGIILINYAGVKTYGILSMRGDYIVKALVDNNFRFPLLGK